MEPKNIKIPVDAWSIVMRTIMNMNVKNNSGHKASARHCRPIRIREIDYVSELEREKTNAEKKDAV